MAEEEKRIFKICTNFVCLRQICIFLREGLKIKALLILVSWAVFFAHSLIPHLHSYEGHFTVHTSHEASDVHENHDCGSGMAYGVDCEEDGACNLVSPVFHNSHEEQQFTFVLQDACHTIILPVQKISYTDTPEKIPLSTVSSRFLRGPPIV